MFRKHPEEDESPHGNRPWVYFMIDAFFLCTQFFVVTFRIKCDDVVLPQKLPPGGQGPGTARPDRVCVHVSHDNGMATYRYLTQPGSLRDLEAALTRVRTAGRDCTVAVSYEATVPYADVLAVFNLCSRLGIRKCGLIPLHEGDAAPGR